MRLANRKAEILSGSVCIRLSSRIQLCGSIREGELLTVDLCSDNRSIRGDFKRIENNRTHNSITYLLYRCQKSNTDHNVAKSKCWSWSQNRKAEVLTRSAGLQNEEKAEEAKTTL